MSRKLCKCGNLAEYHYKTDNGVIKYRSRCATCRRKGQRFKKDHCEKCGFIAEDPCQLDTDHIDMDPSNNDESNVQTLCANCHRLKTKLERIKDETVYVL
jgi:hypothetical protein